MALPPRITGMQGTVMPQGPTPRPAPPMSPIQQQRQRLFEQQQASPQGQQIQQLQQQAFAQQQAGQPVDPAITTQIEALSGQMPGGRKDRIAQMLRARDPRALAGLQNMQDTGQFTPQQSQQFNTAIQQDLASQQTPETPFASTIGGQPLTGLAGSEAALQQGTSGAISALEELLGQARDEVRGGRNTAIEGARKLFGRAISPLESASVGGIGAQRQQAALSGALGPEAQAAAIAAFQESPQQAFLREQGERSITRNAAALGGLGGGRVREELARFGTGLAAQDFANQFSRLGEVANRGQQALTTTAGLRANQAGLETGIERGRTEGLASLLAGQGRDVASILGGAGDRLAGLRERAGTSLANAISGTTQGLANLTNQQGQALTSIFGEGAANVANLFNLAGQGDAAAQEQLAGILTNLGQDEAALLANLFAGQGAARLEGDIAGSESRRDTINRIGEAIFGA